MARSLNALHKKGKLPNTCLMGNKGDNGGAGEKESSRHLWDLSHSLTQYYSWWGGPWWGVREAAHFRRKDLAHTLEELSFDGNIGNERNNKSNLVSGCGCGCVCGCVCVCVCGGVSGVVDMQVSQAVNGFINQHKETASKCPGSELRPSWGLCVCDCVCGGWGCVVWHWWRFCGCLMAFEVWITIMC